MSKARKVLIIILMTTITAPVFADVKVPSVISDNMVLQQKRKIKLWGWADPGEKIKVKASWQILFGKSTKADKDGKWKTAIKTPKAGGPYTITIQGDNKITLNNILVGEVWICSGQSNMEMGMTQINNTSEEIAQADYPNIRLFNVTNAISAEPLEDVTGSWLLCTPEAVTNHGEYGGFSAAAYYFGRRLHKELNVPIGLLNNDWGGTPAEAWTSGRMLLTMPDFAEQVRQISNKDALEKTQPAVIDAHTPTSLYNAMIHPLTPFAIKGAIWYQGESNAGAPTQYQMLFPAMIKSWRDVWGLGDFPFYYVQIAPFNYGEINSAYLREAQFMTLSTPNVGMAVTMDISNIHDIHPKNKKEVGERLALWALAKDYDQKDLVYSGPVYRSMEIEGNKIRLSFDHIGSGLMAKGGALTHFKIAGVDKNFVDAAATIDGDTIVVSSVKIANPTAVRFAFSNNDEPNLYNKEGLPASSFRTDKW